MARQYFMTTQRLGFSRWVPQDGSFARALWGDPAVTRFIAADGAMSDGQVQARLDAEIDGQTAHGMQYWPVFDLADGAFVGCCGLRPYPAADGVLELGFHLLPAYWGRGLAVEAALAAMDYAMEVLGAKGLFAGHHPDNAGSARVLEKLGFRYLRAELYPPTGRMHPSYGYGAVD